MALLTLFLKIFSKTLFYILGLNPRKILAQPEFKYLLGFLRKSKITTRSTVNIDVYNTLLISFLKQFKKFFFHLIEHVLRCPLVFKYLWLILRKSKITAGDTVNIEVYMLSWFHFWSNLQKIFLHLIEHVLRSHLVFKYLSLILRKSNITAGDTVIIYASFLKLLDGTISKSM